MIENKHLIKLQKKKIDELMRENLHLRKSIDFQQKTIDKLKKENKRKRG